MLKTIRTTRSYGGDENKLCRDGETCPAIHEASSHELVVQGYVTHSSNTVRIPAWLTPEWDSHPRRHGDDLFITGRPVTDVQMLADLNLPDGESAVMVQIADMPALEAVPC